MPESAAARALGPRSRVLVKPNLLAKHAPEKAVTTHPAVLDAVREQLEAEPTPGTTEVLLVNAQLLGVENDGDEQRAQVFFDVLMRESPDQQAPSSVREVWHFVRPITGGSWKLDGIQQVD